MAEPGMKVETALKAGKAVAIVAITGAVGYGIYALLRKDKKGIPSGLAILKYQNVSTGVTVTPPNVLEVARGETIKVTFLYFYFGPAVNGAYHLAIWYPMPPFDPHKEKANIDVDFSLPETEKEILITASINIVCDIDAGTYGLYIKIMSLLGPDIFSPYYSEIISVDGGGNGVGWFPEFAELARAPFSVDIVESDWLPAHTELARALFSVNIVVVEYYTLTLKAYPGIWAGFITQEPEMHEYPYGFIVKLTAVSIWPHDFGYWECDGEWLSDANPINFIVIRDHTITAVFY